MKDLTGMRFDHLKVVGRAEDHIYPNGRRDIRYLCECDCGNEVAVLAVHLRSGHTRSCGCYRKQSTKERRTVHGMTKTRLHIIWTNMKARCLNENHEDYRTYGGRGIKVCEEWLRDFAVFAEWSLSNGYDDTLTLDREDVNGNYSPTNCRWATQKVQCNNTRRNVLLTYNGETRTMKEWAEMLGINYGTLSSRIARGWSAERALSKR